MTTKTIALATTIVATLSGCGLAVGSSTTAEIADGEVSEIPATPPATTSDASAPSPIEADPVTPVDPVIPPTDPVPPVTSVSVPALGAQSFLSSSVTATDNGDGTMTFATPTGSFRTTIASTNNLAGYATLFYEPTQMRAAIIDNGEVSVLAVVKEGGVASESGVLYERLAATEYPNSGHATFVGNYVGFIGRGASNPIAEYIGTVDGDVTFDVDFAESEISGTVTNRSFGGGFYSLQDIAVSTAAIDGNGTFSGSVSGGEFGETITTAGTGSYEGLIGGTEGTAAVGALTVTGTVNSGGIDHTYTELGVFHATR